jgi:hypothetical protein
MRTAHIWSAVAALATVLQFVGCGIGVDGAAAGVGSAALSGPTISIDATQLTEMTLLLNGVFYDTKTVVHVPLPPAPVGSYVLEIGSGGVIAPFGVNANGTVAYGAALEGHVFTGAKSATLRVVPHAFTVDASALTEMTMMGFSKPFDSRTVQHFVFPSASVGAYPVELGNRGLIGAFGIDGNGDITYDTAIDHGVFNGLGTSTLSVVPHAIAVDATALSAMTLLFGHAFDSGVVQQLQLPSANVGAYVLELGDGAAVGAFGVDTHGQLAYDASLDGGVFTGLHGSTLRVVPHTITLNAMQLTQTSLVLL